MKTKYILTLIAAAGLFFTACKHDNYVEPKATLSGRVLYNSEQVSVRNNGTQLELWQDGFALRALIPVYVAQDGTFSASLFNGTYKLTRKGNSPWLQQSTDTVVIQVNGNTRVDLPVTPYFTIKSTTFAVANNVVTANFIVDKVVATSNNLQNVKLYLGSSILTDEVRSEHKVDANLATVVLGANSTITTTIPTALRTLPYVFARIGVKSSATGEYVYSQVQKIAVK
ncbi:DUF3823 domain-containing protein [Mucilaginibacter auburnensis]|uniref:Uncharacterized protein DUF3823 n=1 Tax=Mucilaginibacter auburnensis TaxID=1457233 RepID=A0A2H9VRX5_9SPHI|nr:DUF3823 domain-containing protein [Mucilaginibacter auburnensis]PJJ83562.1 uncharacterized protein DUF3823 [Mucilaginibacter auburnensis]